MWIHTESGELASIGDVVRRLEPTAKGNRPEATIKALPATGDKLVTLCFFGTNDRASSPALYGLKWIEDYDSD